MKNILFLQQENEQSPKPINGLNKFIEVAKHHGLDLKTLNYRLISDNEIDQSHYYSQIKEAHGFLITSTHLLSDGKIREEMNSRLKEGAIAFADLPQPTQPPKDGDLFFQELGLEPTSIRANAKVGNSIIAEGTHPGLIECHRHGFEYGFRDADLFEGVNSLLLMQPNGLGCFGNAKPILSLPINEISLIDLRKDLFVDGLSRPEFPIMGISAKDDWKGKVIATTAGFIVDPYTNIFGYTFSGIEGGNNLRLTENLVRIISEGFPSPSHTWQEVYSLIHEIELKIFEITQNLLSSKFGDRWFMASCPSSILEKCKQRNANQFPDTKLYIYLDLIDFKNIWKENWNHFSQFFITSSVINPNRNNSLNFFQELNEIRKIIAHPIRQVHSGSKHPSNKDIALLKNTLIDLNSFQV
jgi:hypothetical protein